MNLWIRVQKNKQLNQGLVKVEDLILEKYNANEWNIRQSCDTLAIYKTEKRALEVLDEIQNKINLINLGYDFGSPMIDLKNPTYIYQMPEK